MLKFRMFMENKHRAFFVDKDIWLNDVMPNSGYAVSIDLESLPIKNMKTSDGFLGALTRPSTQADYTIEVYREDSNDPQPINRYTWSVYENITAVSSYAEIVNVSSTHDDNDLRDNLHNYVVIIPDPKDELHWLPTIPSSVYLVINAKK